MNKPVTEMMKKAATGEYLSCRFLLLTDNDKFGPLKTELDNICFDRGAGMPQQRPSRQTADDGHRPGGRGDKATERAGKGNGHGVCRDEGVAV